MTPQESSALARAQYNSVGDDFYVDATELWQYIYLAEMDLATKAWAIQATDTESTVASTQTYDYPTRAFSIKRITYDGNKLAKVDQRDYDELTYSNVSTVQPGTPQYYFDWNRQYSLYPVPDAVGTLSIQSYKLPAAVTGGDQVLDVPLENHPALVDYVLYRMAAKDNNEAVGRMYKGDWDNAVKEARKLNQRRFRSDSPAMVKDTDSLTIVGFGIT